VPYGKLDRLDVLQEHAHLGRLRAERDHHRHRLLVCESWPAQLAGISLFLRSERQTEESVGVPVEEEEEEVRFV
jgi:hypothetical protein